MAELTREEQLEEALAEALDTLFVVYEGKHFHSRMKPSMMRQQMRDIRLLIKSSKPMRRRMERGFSVMDYRSTGGG